eukprot:gene27763-7403_t
MILCFTRTNKIAQPSRRLLQNNPVPTIDVTQDIIFNWAVNPVAVIEQHTSAGGFTLNLASGVSSAAATKEKWIIIHGALMAVAFFFFFPMGILMGPLHSPQELCCLVAQVPLDPPPMLLALSPKSSAACFISAIVIAFTKLDANPAVYGTKGEVHQVLGIICLALLLFQLVIGFWRPAPGPTTFRKVWTLGHFWNGRVLVLSGIAVSFIGVSMYTDNYARYVLLGVSACTLTTTLGKYGD